MRPALATAEVRGFPARGTITLVKRTFLVVPLLLLFPLLQTACSVPTVLPSTALVESSPTPVPTAIPTAAPLNAANTSGFDTHAGNCVDAANQAIALIKKAAAGDFAGNAFTTDMQLSLQPSGTHAGCAATGESLRAYQQYANSAQLQVWALDTNWYYAAQTTRQNWLEAVLHYLLDIYPRADITIKVFNNNVPCGTASVGAGQSGRPLIDVATCG